MIFSSFMYKVNGRYYISWPVDWKIWYRTGNMPTLSSKGRCPGVLWRLKNGCLQMSLLPWSYCYHVSNTSNRFRNRARWLNRISSIIISINGRESRTYKSDPGLVKVVGKLQLSSLIILGEVGCKMMTRKLKGTLIRLSRKPTRIWQNFSFVALRLYHITLFLAE